MDFGPASKQDVAEQWLLETSGPAATQTLGARLGQFVQPGDVIALQGDLGAGKTNFVQGLARGLGITEDVNSPTFILANEYPAGRVPLYHIDAYRVENAAEALGFGLEDYLDSEGVTVIEWAERVQSALPSDTLWLALEYVDDNTRRLQFTGTGERAQQLIRRLKPEGA